MSTRSLFWIAPIALAISQVVPVQAGVGISSGTPLVVRLDQSLDTRNNNAGDRFTATLVQPVQGQGVVLPAGTRFTGHLTAADSSGRLEGRAILALTLDSFVLGGREYAIGTDVVSQVSKKHKKRNLKIIGGSSAAGAVIGAIAGGGAGAAIGALVGGGAGTAGAAATGKRQAALPVETALTFRLTSPVRM